MKVPAKVIGFLEDRHVNFSIAQHPYTQSSLETAHVAHIRSNCLAKGVLLYGADGYVLAVVPASHELRMPMVEKHVGRRLAMAPEQKLADAFDDCSPGAVPAFGAAYGLRTIVDTALEELPKVYFEAGDHRNVIEVDGRDLNALLADAERAPISAPRTSPASGS